ncbi:MAG: alpha/beta hydrolase, partial [Bacteroidota bacterium]
GVNISNAQKSVKTKEAILINGIKQWIVAEGKDDTKPVLLFLHGGPGFSSRAYSKQFVKRLRKDFIIVQWDQRETALTAYFGPYEDSLTVDLFHQDTEAVVDYLLQRFKREKIYLVGFSWGGFLGMHYAKEHPENLHAYVSVSSIVYANESERMNLVRLQNQAVETQHAAAQADLAKVRIPFQSWQDLYHLRWWTAELLGNGASEKIYPKTLFQEWSKKWLPVFREAAAVDYRKTAPSLNCPVYFFLSKRDFVANHELGEAYFQALQAERKELIWFHESPHEIPSDEPEKFSEEILEIARGLVEK